MEHLPALIIIVFAAMALVADLCRAGEPGFDGFSFTIPYGGLVEGSAPEALARPEAPAGQRGFVQAVGDAFRLSESGRPIRFWATNLCFGACFPPHEVAERMARRMASLGINCVRFHHMDMAAYPRGIWQGEGAGDFAHTELHPEALDRLDYLTSRLKAEGIYTNLNLHVSRTYGPADGFPAAGQEEAVPRFGKGVDIFYPRCIAELKRYARMLLEHENAYTGNTYAREPAVAMVEISNEDGLLFTWQNGRLDRLPAAYLEELTRQWNRWLRERYGSTAALREAWSEGEVEGGGRDLVASQDARARLQVAGDAAAEADQTTGAAGETIRSVAVHRASPTSWHVQHMWAPLRVEEGTTYRLRISLRANEQTTVGVDCRMAHEPWDHLGLQRQVKVGPEWEQHELYFTATADEGPQISDGGARISLSRLSQEGLRIWFTDPELTVAPVSGLPEGAGLEEGLGWPSRKQMAGRTPRVRRDAAAFLRDTELAFWAGMRDYLKGEVGVRGAVTGTAVFFTTPHVAAETGDFVDSHNYWQHPRFPGRPWDPENWVISPRVMVNNPASSTIGKLAGRRVFDLPYTVTEYNHPAPHRHEAEGFPLAAVYGSQQGWDGLFSFTYASGERWERDHFSHFFSIAGHPLKMAQQPACSHLFCGRLLSPPPHTAAALLTLERRLQMLGEGTWPINAYAGGVSQTAWQRALVGLAGPGGAPTETDGTGPELSWEVDEGRGLVRYRGRGCAGLIGFAAGRTLAAGGLELKPGETSLDGFSVVMLSAVDGQDLGEEGRYLITALSGCANEGMQWNEAGNSVGRQWGQGPTRCEGVPVQVRLVNLEQTARIYPLSPDGSREGELEATQGSGAVAFELGPRCRTLWYEMTIGK